MIAIHLMSTCVKSSLLFMQFSILAMHRYLILKKRLKNDPTDLKASPEFFYFLFLSFQKCSICQDLSKNKVNVRESDTETLKYHELKISECCLFTNIILG